ncbi:LuxR C-terminal-related transcriptional regulator [Arthrobacter sp. KNU40]|uniref:helix-turn-helix transcriptional regulator n=1 Tax=Arthrobacter sp. KNU40 TaxID=3447965 RepID=UPI003F62DDFE
MFEQEIKRILAYAAQGVSVRVTGAPGSGRTTVATKVVSDLKDQGVKVHSIFATPLLLQSAFAGVLSLGIDMRSRPSGILSVADLVSEKLVGPGSRLLVIDGVDNLDRESLTVVDIVQRRTQLPLITTMSDASSQSKASAMALHPWPEANIELAPLRFGQVNTLLTQILGAPADVNVVARVLTKSDGNLRLVTRIVHTAVLSKRLVLSHGRWRMTANTLLNEHLHGTVEALLHGLDRDEARALDTISLLGTHPLDETRWSIKTSVLDGLERRGLVSVFTGSNGLLHAAVSPPLVSDYLRDQALRSRKILSSTIEVNLDEEPLRQNPITKSDVPFFDAISAMKKQDFHNAAAVRHFHERLRTLEQSHYKTWDSDRSVSNAATFLRVSWGANIDPPRIERVFKHTSTSPSDPADLFFFTMTRALWTVASQNDLTLAKAMMLQLAESEPGWAAEAKAFAIFLEATYNKMPEDLDGTFAQLTSRNPTSGVIAVVRGLLELYRYDPDQALDLIDSAEGFEVLPQFEPFIRGLALYATGKVDEALVHALARREEAVQAVDQFGLVANTYVAALALVYRGFFEEAEYLMGWTFSVRQPGFLVKSLHNAMLRLSSLRNGAKDPSLAMQVGSGSPNVGPLPAMGKGVYELATFGPKTAEAFDKSATRLIDETLDHGYVLEAVYTALFSLCLLPGPRVRERLGVLLEQRGVKHHDQLLAIADALLEGDLQELDVRVEGYTPDGDLYQVAMILRGAAVRSQLKGDAIASAAIEGAAKRFEARYEQLTQYMDFDPETSVAALTVRETEIALLAGHRSNQEIAAEHGLSVRTVETHISNALRKTQTATRNALFELVRFVADGPQSAPEET